MVAPIIFGIIILNNFLANKIVHCFTSSDITPDNSEDHRSFLNCSLSAWNLHLNSTFRCLEFGNGYYGLLEKKLRAPPIVHAQFA
jgi:hypothetical protein